MPAMEPMEPEKDMKYAGPKIILAIVLMALSAAWAVQQDAEVKAPLEVFSRSAKLLAHSLPLMHLNKTPWDTEIASQALENFIESLDFERSFFLKSDIEKFRAEAAKLPEQVKRGDLQFALDVYSVFQERVRNRVNFVHALLEEPVDFEVDETYFWKRKYADWPEDEAAWDDLWRKKIKNQLLVQLVEKELGDDTDVASQPTGDEDEDQKTHSQMVNESLSPTEQVLRSYDRYLTVMEDNDETWVAEKYLTSFARAFDPHTDYMSPNSVEDFEINMKLSLVGIGALLSNEEGAALVERLIPGGPAEQDGRLQSGDKIIAVAQGDGEPVDVMHWPLYKTVRLIRGEKNTKVVLSVIPASDPTGTTVTQIDLVRDEVKLEEQAAKGELKTLEDPDGKPFPVGVITLPDFYADLSGGRFSEEARSCTRDVERLIEELTGEGAEAIILDLRNNGGGSLAEAIQLTGLFIDTGPVVQVRDRRNVRTLSDRNPTKTYDGPLVVLINRLSASASEIVAGALQDYGRAILVGDSKTHGKGTVQSLAPLSSANPKLGSAKVTTASFYRIAGGSTQLKGVQPDIIIPSALETMELGEESLDNPLPWSTVEPARYNRYPVATNLFAQLETRSAQRYHQDSRFETYRGLLERMKERQSHKEITLRFEDRLAYAREQKALQEQIEKKEGTDQEGKMDDLVLEEAERIARDWWELTAPAAQQASTSPGHPLSPEPLPTF